MKIGECTGCSYFRCYDLKHNRTDFCKKYFDDIENIKECRKKTIFKSLKSNKSYYKNERKKSYDERLTEGFNIVSTEDIVREDEKS